MMYDEAWNKSDAAAFAARLLRIGTDFGAPGNNEFGDLVPSSGRVHAHVLTNELLESDRFDSQLITILLAT